MRLPRDYARCQDGVKCPFASVCARRTTIDTDQPYGLYSYAMFFYEATKDNPLATDIKCEHLIVDPSK